MSTFPSEVAAAILKEHRVLFDEVGNHFAVGVEERCDVLSKGLDSEGVAKSVMTLKYSREATSQQVQGFADVLSRGVARLVDEFLCGLEPAHVDPDTGKVGGGRARVSAKAAAEDGRVYPLQFTYVEKGGEWKYQNVILNGINVGKLLRDQFADAMLRSGNDLDKVVDGWAKEVEKARTRMDSL